MVPINLDIPLLLAVASYSRTRKSSRDCSAKVTSSCNAVYYIIWMQIGVCNAFLYMGRSASGYVMK
jgi:hypothetical protein